MPSWTTFKATARRFRDDNLMDWAAALTYYAVLALFPALIVMVALLGLLGQYPQTTNALLEVIEKVSPGSAVDTFKAPIEGVVKAKGGAGALLGIGLLVAIWSASGYIGAFIRACNAIYDVHEGRPFWKLRPIQIAITLGMVVVFSAVAVALVITGPLAEALGDVIGLGDTAVTVWNIAKWPVLIAVVMTTFALLYHAAPNVRRRRFRIISAGSIVAVLLWIVASAGFAFYVGNFASYNSTYGSLGAVIVFLIWLWITNLAVLFGAELDAQLEREGAQAPPESALRPTSETADRSSSSAAPFST
jgi:membrane protein